MVLRTASLSNHTKVNPKEVTIAQLDHPIGKCPSQVGKVISSLNSQDLLRPRVDGLFLSKSATENSEELLVRRQRNDALQVSVMRTWHELGGNADRPAEPLPWVANHWG